MIVIVLYQFLVYFRKFKVIRGRHLYEYITDETELFERWVHCNRKLHPVSHHFKYDVSIEW